MSFYRPQGRIKVNTKKGHYRKVSNLDMNAYILINENAKSAESEREYYVNGEPLTINKYKSSMDLLLEIDF